MSRMSTPFDHDLAAVEDRPAEVAARLRDVLLNPVEAAAFWSAVVLPFLHVPLLLSGLNSGSEVVAFGLLLVLNVVAIVLGHSHHRD